jgi:hypothetical protein
MGRGRNMPAIQIQVESWCMMMDLVAAGLE